MRTIRLLFFAGFLLANLNLTGQNLLVDMIADSAHYHYYNSSISNIRIYNAYDTDNLLKEKTWVRQGAQTGISYSREQRNYDSQQRIKDVISFESSDTSTPWQPVTRTQYEFDTQNQVTFYKIDSVDGSGWKNDYQYFFWFDNVLHRDSTLDQEWDDAGASWENTYKSITQSLPNGKVSSYERYQWKDGNWKKYADHNYLYDGDGTMLRDISTSVQYDSIFTTNVDTFLYDAVGRLDSQLTTTFQTLGNQTTKRLQLFTYDSDDNLIQWEVKNLTLNGTVWMPGIKRVFEPGDGYYSNDFSLEEDYLYKLSTATFQIHSRTLRYYTPLDPGRVLFERFSESLSGQTLVPNTDVSIWFRFPTVGTSQATGVQVADCQFANPFSDGRYIICDAPDSGTPIQVTIHDSYGRLMHQLEVMPGELFAPHPGIANGMYYISVQQKGAYLGVKKMVIARDR